MIFNILILIVTTMLGGVLYWVLPSKKVKIDLLLVFAGSYLFSITIIHLLPELFEESHNHFNTALFILAGFFLQQVLEYFSSGIEHGHFHPHEKISNIRKFSILIALIIHSLLEGSLLNHGAHAHHSHDSQSLLLGIILHKAPAAFVLMVALGDLGKKAVILLLLFSLASPLGLLISDSLALDDKSSSILFAIVGGSFLHISTTIFVESSPNHQFKLNKILISIFGALVAIIAEYFM